MRVLLTGATSMIGRATVERLRSRGDVVTVLQRYGVRHVFGLCGDTSLPIYDAFYRLDHGNHPCADTG